MTLRYQTFFSTACIAIAIVTGALIFIPLGFKLTGTLNLAFIIFGAAMGGLIGYRRRTSRVFFYACLVSVLLLSTLFFSANGVK